MGDYYATSEKFDCISALFRTLTTVDVPKKFASASRNSLETLKAVKEEFQTCATTNMPAAVRNTVDRLDKPSAYYQSRVSDSIIVVLSNRELG